MSVRVRQFVTHPGEQLREDVLEANELSVSDAAKLLGVTRTTLSKIVNKKSSITANMALRISKVFGGTPHFWLRLQMEHDLNKAEKEWSKKSSHNN